LLASHKLAAHHGHVKIKIPNPRISTDAIQMYNTNLLENQTEIVRIYKNKNARIKVALRFSASNESAKAT